MSKVNMHTYELTWGRWVGRLIRSRIGGWSWYIMYLFHIHTMWAKFQAGSFSRRGSDYIELTWRRWAGGLTRGSWSTWLLSIWFSCCRFLSVTLCWGRSSLDDRKSKWHIRYDEPRKLEYSYDQFARYESSYTGFGVLPGHPPPPQTGLRVGFFDGLSVGNRVGNRVGLNVLFNW